MRFARLLTLGPVVLVAWAACSHDEPITAVNRDGSGAAAAIDMLSSAATGFPGGAFNSVAPFDTSVADAFGRSAASPANYMIDPGGACYGDSLVFEPGAAGSSYTPPKRYLP